MSEKDLTQVKLPGEISPLGIHNSALSRRGVRTLVNTIEGNGPVISNAGKGWL
jgi:hypothetical protein